MKINWSKPRAMIAAAALVLVSNALALGGVAYNRGGEPDSVLQLTERELPIQRWSWPDNENSAVHLQLYWRVPRTYGAGYWEHEIEWLTPEQLRELGFDTPPLKAAAEELDRYGRQTAREVFFALEYDGPAYRAAVEQCHKQLRAAQAEWAAALLNKELKERVESATKEVEREENHASRLFVVAAGVDAETLRKRYPDRKHYAIVRGLLDVYVSGDRLVARARDLSTDAIRVPHVYRTVVEPYLADATTYVTDHNPRYTATVHFGRRLEPWIVLLSRM
jgi:hypothetical protein